MYFVFNYFFLKKNEFLKNVDNNWIMVNIFFNKKHILTFLLHIFMFNTTYRFCIKLEIL